MFYLLCKLWNLTLLLLTLFDKLNCKIKHLSCMFVYSSIQCDGLKYGSACVLNKVLLYIFIL